MCVRECICIYIYLIYIYIATLLCGCTCFFLFFLYVPAHIYTEIYIIAQLALFHPYFSSFVCCSVSSVLNCSIICSSCDPFQRPQHARRLRDYYSFIAQTHTHTHTHTELKPSPLAPFWMRAFSLFVPLWRHCILFVVIVSNSITDKQWQSCPT